MRKMELTERNLNPPEGNRYPHPYATANDIAGQKIIQNIEEETAAARINIPLHEIPSNHEKTNISKNKHGQVY
jgi:hypothetical protein